MVNDREIERRIAARRAHWPARSWRTSERGNSFLNVAGFNITVFPGRRGYGIRISQRFGERQQFGKLRFPTRLAAQAAAFEALLWAQRTWGGNGRYDMPPPAAPCGG